MRENVRLGRKLEDFRLSSRAKLLSDSLRKKGFCLGIIPQDGDFSEYIGYVLENQNNLEQENKYLENNLLKGDSWGEILVVKKKSKIVASFGPNRVEKDKNDRLRARPGYFTVLPKFRHKRIGTALWWLGLERMKREGAEYVRCSVEKKNLAALRIYLNFGMRPKKEFILSLSTLKLL